MLRGNPDIHAEVVKAASAEDVSVSLWMAAAARRPCASGPAWPPWSSGRAEHGPLTGEELDAAPRRRHQRAQAA